MPFLSIALTMTIAMTAWLTVPVPSTDDDIIVAQTSIVGQPATPSPRVVELAICLDTSGSMNGLINAARQKLWAIVNDLALADPMPDLRVALLTFGNDGHDAENGWVYMQTPFTTDLDLVSQRLFALTTNGGTELVGRVIDHAVGNLPWTEGDDALKLVIVAGNESADQDQVVSFRDACKRAIESGIMVNSIYCGNPADDIAPGWKEVSMLADGHYAAIDQEQGTIVISTPFDAELATLSAAVNKTYLPYGARGAWGCSNQIAQDSNAQSLNDAAAASRALTKCTANYRNDAWDLVDALKLHEFKLDEIKEEDLPENMRAMSMEERVAHIEAMSTERAKIQEKVKTISQKRQAYIDAEMRKLKLDESTSFDAAIRAAIRAQAGTKGFRFVEIEADATEADAGEAEAVEAEDTSAKATESSAEGAG